MDAGAQLQFLDTSIKTRAESLSGVLQVLTEKRSSIGAVSPSGSEEEKKSHGMEVTGLNNAIQAAAEHLNATVATVKDRELETAAYTQQLIEATGELTEDIFKGEVALGLLQGWLENGKDWILDNGPSWLFKIIVFSLILVTFRFLAGITRRLVRKAVTASQVDLSQLLQNQITAFAGKVVLFE